MYAIFSVIHGVHVTQSMQDQIEDATDMDADDWIKDLSIGGSMYSGSADEVPMYIGIELCTFDECDVTPVTKLKLNPSPEEEAQVREMLSKVEPILGTLAPTTFFLPSTS